MAAEDYTKEQYNEHLHDLVDGPFYIIEEDNIVSLVRVTGEVITTGDYEHVAKRAYLILKENGCLYSLIND